MPLEAILANFATRSFHVVELATALLNLCRQQLEILRGSLLNPAWAPARAQVREQTAEIVRDRGLLDDDDAIQIGHIVTHQRGAAPDVLMARAIAEGLDIGAGQFFSDWFHGSDIILAPNEPFPVADSNVRKWVTKSTGSPVTRTEPLDRLPRLRVAPVDFRGLRVAMRSLDAQLAELEHVERFAVGVVAEPDVFKTFTWERYTEGGLKLFFDVRPNDPAILEAKIRALVDAAEARDVDLLLLPELVLTADIHQKLVAARTFAKLPFVLAGSYHTPRGHGPGQNECTLFVHGRSVASHRKFRPVIFPDRFDDSGVPALTSRQEHLAVEHSLISVLFSGDWSVATLICKDVMDNAVQEMLRELAVQLVLVPAMSPKVEDFADLARQLGRDPQSFTLVANVGETVAIVGTPGDVKRVNLHGYSERSLFVFDRRGNLIAE